MFPLGRLLRGGVVGTEAASARVGPQGRLVPHGDESPVSSPLHFPAHAAILQLFREGFVEAVQPHRRASHIYAHQIMALSIQLAGVPPGDVDAWLHGATAFEGLSDVERASVVEHMLREGVLVLDGGRLHLGPAGEKPFGSANFRNLYAVFEAPRLITVSWHQHEVGTVDAQFLVTLCSGDTPATFTLAGKAWTAVLMSEENDPAWSQRAVRVLETSRAEHLFLHDEALPLLAEGDDLVLWTFAGGAANVLLARMIEAELGGQVVSRNTSLTLKDEAAKSAAAVRALLAKWREEQRPTVADARVHAEGAVRGRVSKFQGCLPEALLLDLLVTSAVDVEGARRVVGEGRPADGHRGAALTPPRAASRSAPASPP